MAEGKSEIPPSVLQSINPWPSRPPPGSVDHEHPAENTTLSLVIPNEPSTTPVRISITPELAEKLSDLAASFFWIFNFTIRGSPFVESGSTENIDEVQEEIKEKFGLEPLIGSDATMNNVFIRLSLKCSVFDLHHLRSIVKEKLPIDDKHVLIDQIDQVQTKVKKIKSQSEMVKLCKIINSNDSQGKKVQLNLPAGDWMKQVMIHMLFVMKHILAKVHNVEEPEIYIKRGEKGGLTVDECLKENDGTGEPKTVPITRKRGNDSGEHSRSKFEKKDTTSSAESLNEGDTGINQTEHQTRKRDKHEILVSAKVTLINTIQNLPDCINPLAHRLNCMKILPKPTLDAIVKDNHLGCYDKATRIVEPVIEATKSVSSNFDIFIDQLKALEMLTVIDIIFKQ